MNILKNESAMKIIDDAAEKLHSLGLSCWVCPTGLGEYGMTVVLHVAENELAAAAAVVATRAGSIAPHVADANVRAQFDKDVADYIGEAAIFKASGR